MKESRNHVNLQFFVGSQKGLNFSGMSGSQEEKPVSWLLEPSVLRRTRPDIQISHEERGMGQPEPSVVSSHLQPSPIVMADICPPSRAH